jgi:hypothetical protein
VIAGPKLLIHGFGPEPAELVRQIPLGSEVSSLDHYLDGALQEQSATVSLADRDEEVPYGAWRASEKDKDNFTGDIEFFDMGFFSSEVYRFKYVGGLLVEKDWGFLPG